MERLPPEINTKILIGFPIKTLSQLKCVSKSFNTFLKSHHFTKLHRNQTSSEDGVKVLLIASNSSLHTVNILDKKILSRPLALPIPSNLVNNFRRPTSLVGTCMGLVCLRCPPNTYSLLNPTTREFRVLPNPRTFWFNHLPPIRLSGFGYVPLLDDFMVVCVAIYKERVFAPVIKVYSSKADSWKTKRVRVEVPLRGFISDHSVYINGFAYWLGWSGSLDIDGNILQVCRIVGFDFAKEEFSTMLLPENFNQSEIKAFTLLDGCLCVLVRDTNLSLGIWVMKELGVVESWTKTFSFRRAFAKPAVFVFPICDAGNEVLFEINLKLVLYDPVKNIATKLKAGLREIKNRDGRLHMTRYEESLISPYGYICQERHIASNMGEKNEGVKHEEIAGLKEEIKEMSLKLSDVGAREKGILEKLEIAEKARADEKSVMEKRIKELEDDLSRLRLENEEAWRSMDEALALQTRLRQEKDDAAKEVADLKKKLARVEDELVQNIEGGYKACYRRLAAAGIDVSGHDFNKYREDLGPKNEEKVARDEVA